MKKKENKKGLWIYCPFPESTHWRDPSGFECTLGDIVISPNGYEFIVVKSDYGDCDWGLLGSTDSFTKLTDCNLRGYKKISNINDKTGKKMKVELIEEVRYNETIYYVKVDGSYVAKKNTYEEAKEEFDKAFTFVPKTTILEVKEVEL
jgi:hypothetical protein